MDPPKAGEVRVRLTATSICHSDIHLIRGEWGSEPPIVPGHEAAGVIEEIGDNVVGVKVGDAAVVSLIRNCGRCYYCLKGQPQMCEGEFALGVESRLKNLRGDTLAQGLFTAGFAQQIIVDQSQVVIVAADFPLDRAALLACGVITGVGAVINTAQVEPGSSVAVIGTGGVGLNSIQGAALAGASPIIAIDLLDSKLETALHFGATATINASREDTASTVRAMTKGRGVDYVFVTVGSVKAMCQGLDLLGKQGTEVLVGIPEMGAEVAVPAMAFVRGEKKIIGSRMGSTRLNVDIPDLIRQYDHGRLRLDELITARYPLESINEAIEAVEKGQALRNVIMF